MESLVSSSSLTHLNNLARFHKLPYKFTLISETGPPHQRTFHVELKIGDEVCTASGPSLKKAQHSAAATALEKTQYSVPPMRHIDSPKLDCSSSIFSESENGKTEMAFGDDVLCQCSSECPIAHTPISATSALAVKQQPTKSVVNEVQELASMFSLPLLFEVLESTPCPANHHVIRCTCGSLVTVGEGANKKTAKKTAADKMLNELRSNLGVHLTQMSTSRPKLARHKPSKMDHSAKQLARLKINEKSMDDENYVGHLIRLQQAKKEAAPVFTDVGLQGAIYVMQVSIGALSCTGHGRTKMLAKKDAALKMLIELGCALGRSPSKSALRRATPTISVKKQVSFTDTSGSLVDDAVNCGPSAEGTGLSCVEQLQRSAVALGLTATFTDIAADAGSDDEYLSVVAVSTCPPQISHGTGTSAQLARHMAAAKAVELLKEYNALTDTPQA